MNKDKDIVVRKPKQSNTLLAGALVGAGAGIIAAMLIQKRAERRERDSALTVTEGIKIGLLVFGLLRAIAALGDDD